MNNASVFVINMKGEPLMPTTPEKARKLLKKGKAKVVRRTPFTIQMLVPTGKNNIPVTLKIDSGYKFIGVSATTDKKELFRAEVELRTDIPKKIQEKSMYRRNRRYRLWYRKPRFNNRVSTKKKDWLAPSIQHKFDSHIRLVNKISSFLPISKVVVEVAAFDIQKIKNPEITNLEYQNGEQLGFYNLREYILHRDNHICQKCKGKDKILELHHLRERMENQASNKPEELITVCKDCHSKHHDALRKGNLKSKDIIPITTKINDYKAETFMSTVRWKLVDLLKCNYVYGYQTKMNRIKFGLEKSHSNDAFCIENQIGIQKRNIEFKCIQTRRNNRKLQIERISKNGKYFVRRQKYPIQKNDLVIYENRVYKSGGMCNNGTRCYLITDNKKITILTKKVKLLTYGIGLEFR